MASAMYSFCENRSYQIPPVVQIAMEEMVHHRKKKVSNNKESLLDFL